MKYTVWDATQIRTGTAAQILTEIIHKDTSVNSEINGMNLDQYTQAIIGSADYYLPKPVAEVLRNRSFTSNYDKALTFLASMPASGMSILATEPDPESGSIKGN